MVLRGLRLRVSCRRDAFLVLSARSKCASVDVACGRLHELPSFPRDLCTPSSPPGFALGKTAALLGFSAYTVVTVAALLAVTFR